MVLSKYKSGPSSNPHGADVKCGKNIDLRSKNKFRRYNRRYLSFYFTSTSDEIPNCLICSDKLSNETMVPSKLKRHLLTKHGFAFKKPLYYFKMLASNQNSQISKFIKHSTVSYKAQKTSYAMAKMKSHTTAE